MRDKPILESSIYNAGYLFHDVLGDLVANHPAPLSPNFPSPSPSDTATADIDFHDDDVATRTEGLIVWDGSWDMASWGLTPDFVRKWGWLLEGCDELIASSNRWRARRDEEPLYLTR